jgi:DNA helicase-2/ATP-dependent DNA helicase PcrA
VVRTLIDDVGLGGAVATLDRTRHGMNRASQGDDLSALIQLATMHREVATFESWLRDVLGRPGRADGVTLATVHRVKGQEWPVVVVHQATADQFPHRLADNIEEERRLFHVAITRGADEVVVVVGEPPNPFVAQLTSEPPAVAEREARRDLSASAASRLSGRRSRVPMNDPAERLAARDVVLAAPGLVLVDGGQEWTVIEVGEDGVVAVHGAARWRFPFGAQVVTAGRQRGVLARPEPGIPPAAIRAYDSLRQWRESVRQGKPAYVVFDDATLARIAGALPVSLDELARVKGVGPLKLDQYGDAVLAVIEDPLGWEEDHRP